MNPFNEKRKLLLNLKELNGKEKYIECPECEQSAEQKKLRDNLYVCPNCGYHYSISAKFRISQIVDDGAYKEIGEKLSGGNPLDFPGYEEKIAKAQEDTGLKEAVITAIGRIHGEKAVVCAMDSRFMMASMGAAVGEKITAAFEYGTRKKLPVIIFTASGGARMQEGIVSLFQMAKTSAAVGKHSEAGNLFVSVMTNPTTGGVTASFASLGDIILAEPDALIGFAGPRVIEQTIGQALPEGFQRAEHVLQCGFVDRIVKRTDLRNELGVILKLHSRKQVK